ncbi:glutamine--fructose-6-phosphate transaminase (isomerizing) [Patescibacteria group bacterium]|nr:glutamine--fructose-6-phosphate transaminase (isomerizing) [Patescibacteria group bacterium]
MCGIVGYIGKSQDIKIGLNALKRLEYRGYDSSGVAWVDKNKGEIVCIKSVGKINNLEQKIEELSIDLVGNPFILHTRWATHGGVTEANAHPHWDCKKNIYLVHNGIIENYKELKEELLKEGHIFNSETDTEVLAHLIEKFFQGNLEQALMKALRLVKGTYGLVVIAKEDPGKIVVARNSSPISIGVGEDEYIVASDVAAIVGRTKKVVYLNDGEIAVLTPSQFHIQDFEQNKVAKIIKEIDWDIKEAQRGGFPHFMLKEIFEGPEVVENAVRGRLIIEEGLAKLGGLSGITEKLRNIDKLTICACGTSYFASLVGEYMLEEYAGISVEVEYGSEFRYRKPVLNGKTAFLAVSQSGETADTLASLREAKRKGVLTLGIVNVVGSSLTRETDAGVYNHAGPEIGVASTKTFISQLTVLSLLTLFLGRQRQMSQVTGQRIIKELEEIPQKIKTILSQASRVEELAKKYKDFNNFLFLGRKYNLPVALEGALKLKEISYIHAEGYGSGEMKHGPIALIDENFPTFAICPSDSVYEKNVSNIEEIKARKGKVIALATEGNEKIKDLVDDVIYIPKTLEMLTPILVVIPLQLFAYYMGVLLGRDPDYPRNLAKAVVVE